MPASLGERPAIGREDVAVALVEEVATGDAEVQKRVAAAVVDRWRATTAWPAGLIAQSLYVNVDGTSLMTYAQWSSLAALAKHRQSAPDPVRPDWGALGAEPGTPREFRLYRVVTPAVLPDPAPVARCFPVATFAVPGVDAARQWIDGLLENEEENEGSDRAYPGALAANFHVSEEGVFLISEWASEEEVLVHIKEVILPLLEYMGQAGTGPGSLYHFHASVLT
jgi:quinol monooxygenase YgiN